MMPTASPLEWIYTGLALLAWLGWCWEAADIRRRARTQSRQPGYQADGPRAHMHRGDLTGALLQLLILGIFLLLGVGAILTPPPIAIANQVQAERGGIFSILMMLLLLIYIGNRRNTRRRVNRALDRTVQRQESTDDPNPT
jgi:hypothetical protein